jgi:DMSO/TMAO reductase YedYZ molybdopterin-dependent catalytic subunit
MPDDLLVTSDDGERRWSRTELRALGPGGAVAVGRLLEEVGAATHASVENDDGSYRASIPLPVVRAQGIVVHARDGMDLTEAEGGPFRLVVEDGPTLCWNVKHVARIRLTRGPEPDSVPVNPPH